MRSCLASEQCWSWLKALRRWSQLLVCVAAANVSTAKCSAITFISVSERTAGMLKLFSRYYTMTDKPFDCSCLILWFMSKSISPHNASSVNLLSNESYILNSNNTQAMCVLVALNFGTIYIYKSNPLGLTTCLLCPSFHCLWPNILKLG